MKKLSLKSNAFDKGEVLTRAQLKKVMGGTGSGDCGPGFVGYSCTVKLGGSGGTWQEPAVACIPNSAGVSNSSEAATWLLNRYMAAGLCVSPDYCETSC